MTYTTTTGIDEVGELVGTLLATPAHRATACRGWTAHELVAHLTAGAAEEADLIEAHLDGGTERATRALDEREVPYRALPDPELRDCLVEQAARLAAALERLGSHQGDGVLFTGRRMTANDFAMHSRSECTLHRWDLAGRDDIGWAMLSQPELTGHALAVLSAMSTLAEAPLNRLARARSDRPRRVVLRSAPHDDIVITVGEGRVALDMKPLADAPASVELEPAARLLLLWGGYEPSASVDILDRGDERELVTALLGW